MAEGFPDPFSEAVVEEVKGLIAAGDVHNLTIALDAQINSVHVPEWYQSHRISRIYGVLLELQLHISDRSAQQKVTALMKHMREKYEDRLIIE